MFGWIVGHGTANTLVLARIWLTGYVRLAFLTGISDLAETAIAAVKIFTHQSRCLTNEKQMVDSQAYGHGRAEMS